MADEVEAVYVETECSKGYIAFRDSKGIEKRDFTLKERQKICEIFNKVDNPAESRKCENCGQKYTGTCSDWGEGDCCKDWQPIPEAMRTIKFRMWDKNNNKMHIPFHSMDELFGMNGCVLYIVPFQGIEIMQFTGLLDKNGKEIYEGDIIKNMFTNLRKTGDEIEEIKCESIREVIWDEKWASWKLTDEINWGTFEVIGNLYENPELLK